jgi:hypothetical protein
MSQFKNSTNGSQWEKQLEINTLPSMTIPDQTMSINEIMRRFASGLPLGGQRVPEYDGEDDLLEGVNPKTLDLSEIQQLKKDFANEYKELQKQKQSQQKDLEQEIVEIKQQLKQQQLQQLQQLQQQQQPPL